MITKFNTTNIGTPSSGGKSSNTIVYLLVGAVAIYLAYRYVIKPQMEDQEQKDVGV